MQFHQWRPQKNARPELAEVNPSARKTLILAPFKAEAVLLAGILPDCQHVDAATWTFAGGQLATANAAGASALIALLDRELAETASNRIILFGAAGALAPELEIGQVLCCHTALYDDRRLELPVSTDIQATTIITVDEPITRAEERFRLAERYCASLVDMESFFFAEAIQGRGLSGAVIRFVSDTAEQAFVLPFPPSVKANIGKLRNQILRVIIG